MTPVCLFLGRLLLNGSQKASDADFDRSEVGDFVYLDLGVNLVLRLEDLAHLVGGDRVDASAELYELHQLHILACGDVSCRRVQTGMVRPLIQHVGVEAVDA